MVESKPISKQKSLLEFFETQVDSIFIEDIKIENRIRKRIDTEHIKSLAESIREVGLLNPISITKSNDLIAGYHRLHACKSLGWSEIPCIIVNTDDRIDLQILEIDENLLGPKLTALERAEHFAKRQELYLQKYPETKHGANFKTYPRDEKGHTIEPGIPNLGTPGSPTFVKDTVTKTGASKSEIYRKINISKKISPEVKEEIWDTELEDNESSLQRIANLTPEKQRKVVKQIKNREAKKVGEAIARINREEKLRELRDTKPKHQEAEFKPIIFHQDALNFLNSIEDRSQDLLFTDPPYMSDLEIDITLFVAQWVPRALEKLRSSGRAYIFTGNYPEEIRAYINIFLSQDRFELANILIWTYKNTIGPSTNEKYKNNYQCIFYLYGKDAPPLNTDSLLEKFSVKEISAPDARHYTRFFKWQKPDALAELIIRHATQEGDLVIDPFAGSGTFVLKATEMKRYAKGSELDSDALEIAKKRGCIIR